jgi:acetylglutamate synthase
MDITAVDILWFLFSTVTILYLNNISSQSKETKDAVNKLVETTSTQNREIAVIETELHDHIKNTSIHCNYPVCGKRASDG